jgi:hypothetical protein
MGKRSRERVGDAFMGTSEFDGEGNLASLMEALEEAAGAAAADASERGTSAEDEDLEYDVRIVIKARTHNQNVRTCSVIITPGA